MSLTNKSRKSIWVALKDNGRTSSLVDSQGEEARVEEIAGLIHTTQFDEQVLTEMKAISGSEIIVRWSPRSRPIPGECRLQLEFLVSDSYSKHINTYPAHNVLVKLDAK
jgi:hypothetical protein